MRLRRNKHEEPVASETAVAAPPDPEDAAATAAPPTTTGSPGGGESPLSAHREAANGGPRPEILVGAAFAGGFALAQIVKRFGR